MRVYCKKCEVFFDSETYSDHLSHDWDWNKKENKK